MKAKKHTLLVVDDDEHIREFFQTAFEDEFNLITAEDGKMGLQLAKEEKPHLIFLDVRLPRLDGLKVLERLPEVSPRSLTVMVTANKDAETAVAAMKMGAYDYIIKPFDLDRIRITMANCLDKVRLTEELTQLRDEVSSRYSFFNIIGTSPSMRRVFDMIGKVLDNSATILITGESGTGKELIARAIHYNGIRKDKPFVAVNAAAIPETLVESELFGHEKGAFTGAVARKPGKFEQANEGTLFLDEIGSIRLDVQSKLLRALQERQVERLGGTKSVDVDVRVITATSVNLEESIKKGDFREDLYYRLNVVPIHLPPLRERVEDIPILARHFLEVMSQRFSKRASSINPEAMEVLAGYPWPGNVRELENIFERIVVMLDEKEEAVGLKHIPEKIRQKKSAGASIVVGQTLEQVEAAAIAATLQAYSGNISRTAEILDVTRKTLRAKIKAYGLSKTAAEE